MNIIIPFIIGIALMLFLMIKTNIGPFLAMLLASLFIGISCGLSSSDTVAAITSGFGKTAGNLGIVIILGTVLGNYLEKSNATNKIATRLLDVFGDDKALIAITITGFIVAIPVFTDVATIMLAPLAIAVAKKTDKPVGPFATMLGLSLTTTNGWVCPTPAPVSCATILGLDVGVSIIYGLIASAFIVIFLLIRCKFYLEPKPKSWYGTMKEFEDENTNVNTISLEQEMPSLFASIFPIILPIALIIGNTVTKLVLNEGSKLASIFGFLGDKNIALGIGALVSFLLLRKYVDGDPLEPITSSLETSGPVIFITAAGGALGNIVTETGMGQLLADMLSNSSLPVILIPFLIAGLSKFAQGSGSVSVILAATMTVPLVENGLINPVIAFLAVNAGSQLGSHVNNSFFWVFANCFNFDTKTTLKTLSLGQHVQAIIGLVFAALLSLCI